MTDGKIAERLETVEARLLQLEQLLGVNGRPRLKQPAPPQILPIEKPLPVVEFVEPYASNDPLVAPQSPSFAPMPVAQQTPPPLPGVRPAARAIPTQQVGLEQTIGLKWAGWIGAVVLVIGAGFGIKFGYEQGWFSIVTPAVRLGFLTLVALALIGVGEWVYRKVNVLSAVGLFGAGIGLLFVISYAGHAYYHLYERNVAFTFMALSTLIGAAVARRGGMVSIAVLAMIGGNLAPVLLANDRPEFFEFLFYLLLLQLTSLLLAAWGATPKWWTLRGLSLATTTLWVAVIIESSPPHTTLIFCLVYAALFHAELQFSAHRSQFSARYAGVTFSLLVTAALTAAILYIQRNSTQIDRLVGVLGLAVTVGMISVVSRRTKKNSLVLRSLAAGYAIQSLALVAVAVPIAFSGIWITAAWAVLAIACAVAGRLLDLPNARYAAPVVWGLAVLKLFAWTTGDDGYAHHHLIAITLARCEIPGYLLMSGGLAVAGQIIARLSRLPGHAPGYTPGEMSLPLSIIASGVWIVASLNGLSPLGATAAILIYANVLLLANHAIKDRGMLVQAGFIVAAVTIKWAAIDMLLHRLNDIQMAEPMFFGPRGFTGAMVLASLVLLYFVAITPAGIAAFGRQMKHLIAALTVGVILWIGTFSIDQAFINDRLSAVRFFTDPVHAEQMSLSVFWAVFALTTVVIGFIRHLAGLRYFGLTLFAITLLKVVIIDLSQVSSGYRILSFMALGLLLLGTSVLYGKVSPRFEESDT